MTPRICGILWTLHDIENQQAVMNVFAAKNIKILYARIDGLVCFESFLTI